ncbi:hypothetical protein GLOIN_2v1783898 [Rhizophagus clarus]|uniref:Uncharacterized protein n=1 Tax=Rhizophagus clarus TaxID=94130 RepID=A0A8H3LAW3_9GLOM|nr:hypothetical protein GLOIN_2v1783898 [Rhizophagus clarus]
MSETNTLASTENESHTLTEEIEKYKTDELIDFLRKQKKLDLDDDDLNIIHKEKINGRDFLKTTKQDFRDYGMGGRTCFEACKLYQKVPKDVWTSPTVRVGIINDISGPYVTLSKGLIKMGKKCLEFISNESHFRDSYRIELRPINDQKWEYIMQLHSVTWFDMLLRLTKDLQFTLEIARNYVNSIRSVQYSLEYVQSTKSSIPSKVYCGHHADCKYLPPTGETISTGNTDNENINKKQIWTSKFRIKENQKSARPSKNHNSNYEEPPIFCAGLASQQTWLTRYCNWYVEEERIVLNKDGWICVSQHDDVRDILIYSDPMYAKVYKPENHKTNKQLVIDIKFWEWVFGYFMNLYLVETICKQQIRNPIEIFALNFGRWESAEAKDS